MTKPPQPGVQATIRPAVSTASIGIAFFLLTTLMPILPKAFAQALPAAQASPISTGFALPRAQGSLQYAVSASESLSSGYYSNAGYDTATNLSGDLAFLSNSAADPFSMVFSGGRAWSTSGQPSYSFLNLALSQVITTRLWSLVLSDGVNYLPGTATTGLSGVSGVGDLGVDPVQVGATTPQGVLTNYSSRVGNMSTAGLSFNFTGKTSVHASVAYGLTRFLDDSGKAINSGLDSDLKAASGGLSHRINARNTLSANYSYSSFTFNSGEPGFINQTASLMFLHQLTRKLTTSLSAGPQWTQINLPGNSPVLSLYADVNATYGGRFSHVSLDFTRSANSGFGVTAGAISDSVRLTAGRTFARVWNCSISGAYTQTSNLPGANNPTFGAQTEVGGVQVSRAIAGSLSGFASYTLENQATSGPAPAVDLFSGLSKVAGFGLVYSPAAYRIGRQ